MSEINITITVPDKLPFEGRATQKQKQMIWDLGFHNQEIIAELGKKQASEVITQLKLAHGRGMKINEGFKGAIRPGIIIVVCALVIAQTQNKFIEACAYAIGIVALIKAFLSLIKALWHRSMLSRQRD
jgi:hypothetical protein